MASPVRTGPTGFERARLAARGHAHPKPIVYGEPLPWRAAAPVATRLALFATDLLTLALSAALVVVVRSLLWGPMALSWGVAGSCVAWLVLRAHAQLYSGYGVAPPEELRRSTSTTFVVALGHAATLFALKDSAASRFITVGMWAFALPISCVLREAVKAALIRWRLLGHPVIVAGAGRTGALAIRELKANPGLGMVPVALFDDDAAKQGLYVDGVPVLGPLAAALEMRFPYPVQHALLAVPGAGGPKMVDLARRFAERYSTLGVLPDLFGLSNLWVRARAVGACLTLEIRSHRFDATSRRLKRAFDLALGIPLFIASLPIIALAALAVKLASPGRAFYFQEREGLDGRRIRVWKIRTMVPDAEARLAEHLGADDAARLHWQQHMKLRHDPRVVPHVGAFLRKSSLDELPQLWNVVAGEMSLVGPRPFPNYHLEHFSPEFRALRAQVPPGLSGLWQVSFRSDGDLRVQETSDSYYIHNWSIWLDLWILLRTVQAVLAGAGAH